MGCYPLPVRGHLCPCALAELGAGRARPATQPSCWGWDVPAKTDGLGKPRQCLALLPAFPTFTLLPSPLPAPPAFTLLPTLPAFTSISPPHMTPHSPCSHPCTIFVHPAPTPALPIAPSLHHLCSPCLCSPRLPSIGAAGASVRQPTCHPCYSLCCPYTLLPSTPTCPPCFAAALSLHPAVQGSHAEHHPALP